MHDYKREFLEFAIDQGVMRFGEFTLKSGRVSPYFFNAGLFCTGGLLARVGRYYAATIMDSNVGFDMVFGPAYKGIPLATACAIALADHHDRDVPWAFNRKEAKDHGEGGMIVGAGLSGRVLIVDDVITAGTAIRESMAILRSHGVTAAGVVIALDRQERGQGSVSAIQEVEAAHGIPVISIATLDDIIALLEQRDEQPVTVNAMRDYRDTYGV